MTRTVVAAGTALTVTAIGAVAYVVYQQADALRERVYGKAEAEVAEAGRLEE